MATDLCLTGQHPTSDIQHPHCVQFPLPSGNVRKQKFLDIWRHSDQLNELRTIVARDLPVCSMMRRSSAAIFFRCFTETSSPGVARSSFELTGFATDRHRCAT